MKKFVLLSVFLLSTQAPASAMLSTLRQENEIENVRTVQRKINEMVCATSQKVYQDINNHWTYVKPGEEMSVVSEHWKADWIVGESIIEGEKTQTMMPTLILKTSVDHIVEALEDLISQPAALECTIALTTAKIFCMKNILEDLGEGYFKIYAAYLYDMLGRTEGWTTDQFFHELPEQFISTIRGSATAGSFCYLPNISDYAYFKSNGNGRGSNLVCVGHNQYVGFSGMYRNGPKPLEAVEKQDLELFCDPQDVQSHHEEHSEKCKMLQETEGLFESLRREEQEKNFNFHFIFDAQKFIDFGNTGEVYL